MRRWWFWRVRHKLYRRIALHAGRVHGRGPLLVAMGDSHTDPTITYTLPWQVWLRRVSREGYRTVNLGVSGETTADMRRRVEEFVAEGPPYIAVIFGGGNDARRSVDPSETERNVTFMVEWLRAQAVSKIALIGPGILNSKQDPDWLASADAVRRVFSDVAARHDAVFVDLAKFLRDRIARGEDPDYSHVPYRQSRSWHVYADDPHFNAYGQRLIAEAFLAGTADWRAPGHR